VVKVTSEVETLLRACVKGKGPYDYVFSRDNGEPVRNFRGAWYALCEKAGLGNFVNGEDGKPHWRGRIPRSARVCGSQHGAARSVGKSRDDDLWPQDALRV